LPALEHHTYSDDDVEGGIKIKKEKKMFHENGNFFRAELGKNEKIYFYSKSPLLDVGGFTKQGIKKYSPKYHFPIVCEKFTGDSRPTCGNPRCDVMLPFPIQLQS
jgi:hypothetical protein